MSYDTQQINFYLNNNYTLIPLHPYNKMKAGKERGKTPIHKEWQVKQYTNCHDSLQNWINDFHNIGFRIGADDLVIDFDPRNYKPGVDVQSKVAELLGYYDFDELLEDAPAVTTGSGGYHVYCKLPPHANVKRLRQVVETLPGVDFKKQGGYVVSAGSKHPNGNYYNWITQADPIIVTDALLNTISRTGTIVNQPSGFGSVSSTLIQSEYLDHLDPLEYGDNDSWLQVMMECHFASGGTALQEFIDWSTQDPKYSNSAHDIKCRWESLHESRELMRGAGSLIKRLSDKGKSATGIRQSIASHEATKTFEQFNVSVSEQELLQRAKEAGQTSKHGNILNIDRVDNMDESTMARNAINNLTSESESEEINTVLRYVKLVPAGVDQTMMINALAEKVKGKLTRAQLVQALKQLDEIVTQDLAEKLSDLALENIFKSGKHLIVEPNEYIYMYNGTHWVRIGNKYLGRIMQNALAGMRQNIEIKMNVDNLVNQAISIITRSTAVHETLLYDVNPIPDSSKPSIINCKNAEIHIDQINGTHAIKQHSYDSYQTTQLNVFYNPAAQAPIFHNMLQGMFQYDDDPEDMIRHIGEIFGYALQPLKNLGKWWLFIGAGGDGKTTLTQILAAILGTAYVPLKSQTIARNGGSNSDNHADNKFVNALACVVGDCAKGTIIDDEAIKNLADNKTMTANPKGKDHFQFTYSGCLIICSNHVPKTNDNSVGFWRRAQVVPFRSMFESSGNEDVNLLGKIMSNQDEMSGVLNFALDGLKRLRERGRFLEPVSCQKATQKWRDEANNISRFVADTIDKSYNDSIVCDLTTLHQTYYLPWCDNNDISDKYRLGKINFVNAIKELGFKVQAGGKNIRKVYGGTLKEMNNNYNGGFAERQQ